ncbi:MAG: hypothetical protein M0T74_04395 [Desulfitobacterium hafniense]|nr:hypothetical protein [Desulfitobacterium hafniense]
MAETIVIVGWFNVLFFTLALANSVLRFFNIRFINKHYKNTDNFAIIYRKIMVFFIQNHRWFGIATGISVLLHFIVALQGDFLPPTGIVLGLLVLAQVSLGVYGFYFKQRTGRWQRVHRVNGYVIMIIAIVHVILAVREKG